MATCSEEIRGLISKAEGMGAVVHVEWDLDALIDEGRSIITEVQVSGLKGCGPYPMSAITASERLRELTA
jgi:hypothetical protein